MLALYTSRYMRAQASFFFHCRMCLRQLSAPLPCKSLLEPVCHSTCKADLSSHLGCSRLSQCCFLTCKPLACPRSMSMQVYRYSSQESTEQPKCKDLQRTCISSELTKRRVTSRCGGVASAFSIKFISLILDVQQLQIRRYYKISVSIAIYCQFWPMLTAI